MKVAGVHCNSVKSVECSEVESISTVGRSGGAVRERNMSRESNFCALWVWLPVARVSRMTVACSVCVVYAHSRPTW